MYSFAKDNMLGLPVLTIFYTIFSFSLTSTFTVSYGQFFFKIYLMKAY